MDDRRFECLEHRMTTIEAKLDNVLELVSLGKHVVMLGKVLGWVGGLYIALETYIKTVLHK